jgi:hypothetical protein
MAKASKNLEDALKEKPPEEGKSSSAAATSNDEVEEIPVDSDDDDEEPAAASPSRDDKKRERGRRFSEEKVQAERERDELRQQNERLLRVLESQRPSGQPASTGPDMKDIEERRQKLTEDRRLVAERIAYLGNKITPEQEKEIIDRVSKIDDELYDLRAEKRERQKQASERSKPQVPEEVGYIRSKFHHVLRNGDAARYAQGEYLRLRAKGHPDGPETFERSLQEAEREFRLGNTDVSRGQRDKYSGAPSGAGGNGGSGGPRTIRMTPDRMKQADAAFPHIKDEKKRYEHFAKTVGPKILAREKR